MSEGLEKGLQRRLSGSPPRAGRAPGLAVRPALVLLALAASFYTCALFAPGAASAAMKNTRAVCLECHPGAGALLAGKNVHAPVRMGLCTSCHNPHASKHANLIGYEAAELCYTCHDRARILKGEVVHRPVGEGRCLDCHDSHSSNFGALLKQGGSRACFACHPKEELSGGRFVHPEVAKGNCRICHSPHASAREGLLTADRKKICVGCHGDGTTGGHRGISVKGSDCVECHSPHSSDNPGIVRASMHKPFADGKCGACHQPGGGVAKRGIAMCVECHEGVMAGFNKRYTHLMPGAEGNSCTDCHSPHASDKKSLIRDRDARVCYRCHTDTRLFVEQSEYTHAKLKDCTGCHVSHGSDRRYFMASGDGGCAEIGCHPTQGTFTHPVGEDVIDHRLNEPMTCVTCHNPMGSPEDMILRASRDMELCVQCHQI